MSTKVRIYRPTKNAMQSGRANTRKWVLEFVPTMRKEIDPLMGWSGSGDTATQAKLRFVSKEDAVAYAERNGLDFTVQMPQERVIRPKNYSDNFSPNRIL
ncbi:MAG: ETC complex I subunit [Rhodospirillales bacterium]|jgi:hypothetical protein|nr:ETC complex I subunit [Rhodospirillales bacterium]MBT4039867.1 ETC complex I subunit [Rhodospirillales bacterium]MBT4627964.1 ETC complex I subunit [Rhodospirillales bacterium]MBT5350630.1 ETC complex I subunit [Rhodospirillales bacterium]MBT5521285.1 ETC complex I subunit [Rhodospirillales bacterium]